MTDVLKEGDRVKVASIPTVSRRLRGKIGVVEGLLTGIGGYVWVKVRGKRCLFHRETLERVM
ncbi:unnamed protein product [marine sediment metagenome]|uniref:KOW domain-containing protein n=1 Tax=marine sediment metagenome TaxID=412755 RepID=X0TKD2_9ZZZZ